MAMMGPQALSQEERGEYKYAIKLMCVFVDLISVFVQLQATQPNVFVCTCMCECLLCLIVGLSDVPSLIKGA